jgi:hypothetical protein
LYDEGPQDEICCDSTDWALWCRNWTSCISGLPERFGGDPQKYGGEHAKLDVSLYPPCMMDTTEHQFRMLHANTNNNIKKKWSRNVIFPINKLKWEINLPCSEKCQGFQNQHHLHLALLNGCTKVDIER